MHRGFYATIRFGRNKGRVGKYTKYSYPDNSLLETPLKMNRIAFRWNFFTRYGFTFSVLEIGPGCACRVSMGLPLVGYDIETIIGWKLATYLKSVQLMITRALSRK